MGSPCPPRWTVAERAAYFGDRMCAFCDHRNPGGAKFCGECASPLDLKPCEQCEGINDRTATSCHQCGAAIPVVSSTFEVMSALPASDPPPSAGTGRLLRSRQLLVTAIATIVIVGAYDTYRAGVPTRDATGTPSKPDDALQSSATTTAAAAPVVVHSMPIEPATIAGVQVPAADTIEAPQRATPHRGRPPVPSATRAKRQGPHVPARHAPVKTKPPVAHGVAAAPVGARVAQTAKGRRPDPNHVMQASLASCDGDLLARVVCDQRVRLRFCEGHWGESPHCASGIANDHGQ